MKLRDRDSFPVFVTYVRAVEPAVADAVAKVSADVDQATATRLGDIVRRGVGVS